MPPSQDDDAVGARAEYSRRLAARRARAGRLAAAERRIGNWRLVVFLAGVLVAGLTLGIGAASADWLALPIAAFTGLVVAHARVIPARGRADRAVAFYERGLRRLEDRWAGRGETGERFANPDHPYARDLDLFGSGSLFELLCTARTRTGEETLARWLGTAADAAEIRERQEAIDELRAKVDLREEMALLGEDVGAALHAEALAAWGSAPARLRTGARRLAAAALVAAAALGLALWRVGWIGPLPLIAALVGEALFALSRRRRVQGVARAVEMPGRDLMLLSQLLARIEAEPFRAPRLTGLQAALDAQGAPPSRRIGQLRRLVDLLDARRNQLFAPLAPFLLWTTQVAMAVEDWRLVSGAAAAGWIRTVGEFEALCALAGYAYEHRGDPFPEIAETGPLLEGEGLGHPLIPESRCVRNDLRLGAGLAVLVVSGSNMSGKSTLLRTVGINAVLGMAGAPVRARRMRLSPLALGTSMRVQDSLQAGTSKFYAEIRRLRQLVDLAAGPLPLLFLLDEVLHGTNSHDRRIGAEAVVRGLVERGAIGLVTTHDLSLADIAESLAPRAANVHFEDHLENGEMRFDYRMRPGVVKKSNALALMRAVGLEV
jgi:hypothetical protein